MSRAVEVSRGTPSITKVPTGITGLDEVTNGGLPAGRPTLVCGGPGCGKTVLAMEFLVRGARQFDEPGLFVSFEETPGSLIENFRSLGFEVEELVAAGKLKIVHVDLTHGEIVETGTFSLDGLFIRLKNGIAEIGAKRVVIDTLETVFSTLSASESLRSEIARLFQWLREAAVSTVVTGERGDRELTRHGFEEYVSDCVLLLDHRVAGQLSKRRLRIVKYRGSAHGKDEYPFLIGRHGFSVLPITAVTLDHAVSLERVSTGVPDLDALFGGAGYFRGSAMLVSGKAGTGKTSLSAAFARAATERGDRCLYLSFEESAGQIVRNMRSVGLDLGPGLEKGLLTIRSFRPTYFGLEEHLVAMMDAINEVRPVCIVMDPITNFVSVGAPEEVRSMLARLMDHLRDQKVTLFMTALTAGSGRSDETEANVSSMIDTWIALDQEEVDHTRQRQLYVVKSRGMEHSHATYRLLMSQHGLSLTSLSHPVTA